MTPTPIAQLVQFAGNMRSNIDAIYGIMIVLVIGVLVLFWGFMRIKKKVIHASIGDSGITHNATGKVFRYRSGRVDKYLTFR